MDNLQYFFDYFKSQGLTDYGVAGLMGNIKAESDFNSKNLQGSFEKKLNMTDESYTKAVDDNSYKNFIHDSAGYGIAQWTYWSRKEKLYNYIKSLGKSIGDFEAQTQYLAIELKTYTGVWKILQTANSVREASDAVLLKYERPANQSEAVQIKRASYGQAYYDKYANKKNNEVLTMKDYSKYILSTGTHYISNSGSDERGQYTNGAAGDQTGKEWQLKSWYSRPWTVVLRYEKDPRVGELMANLSCAAALNDNIGYDQLQRSTYWTQLKKVNYDPSAIVTKCEEDCTAGVTANTKACGYLLGIKALQDLGLDTYSSNMRGRFVKAGFTALTGSKYCNSTANLLPGDVLLYESHHAAANVTVGANMRSAYKSGNIKFEAKVYKFGERELEKGMTGDDVKELQKKLIEAGFSCGSSGADGDFGGDTEKAVKKFQMANGISADGVVGKETFAKFNTVKNEEVVKPVVNGEFIGVATAKQAMHIRDAAETSGKSLTIVPKDKQVNVYELLTNGWMKVEFLGTVGYTSNRSNLYYNYVANTDKPVDATVIGGYLNVRVGAGTNYAVSKVLPNGTKVKIYEEKNNFGRIDETKQLWCSLSYLKKN